MSLASRVYQLPSLTKTLVSAACLEVCKGRVFRGESAGVAFVMVSITFITECYDTEVERSLPRGMLTGLMPPVVLGETNHKAMYICEDSS